MTSGGTLVKRGNELFFRIKLKKGEIYKLNQCANSTTLWITKEPTKLRGFSNSCEDGKAILLIDYDGISIDEVLRDYKFIQERFFLPPAYLFKTNERFLNGTEVGNYHVVCLKKFLPSTIPIILQNTRCDTNFATMPVRNIYRNYVLRLSAKNRRKVEFIDVIGEFKNIDVEVSQAHLTLLSKLYPNLVFLPYESLDNKKTVYLQEYESK